LGPTVFSSTEPMEYSIPSQVIRIWRGECSVVWVGGLYVTSISCWSVFGPKLCLTNTHKERKVDIGFGSRNIIIMGVMEKIKEIEAEMVR
jgi:hypothetical protein